MFKRFFKRTQPIETKSFIDGENEILCNNQLTKELIRKWVEVLGWNSYCDLFRCLEIETPVNIKTLGSYSFSCNSNNEKVEIFLKFGDCVDFPAEVHVTKGNRKKVYLPNYTAEKPELLLSRYVRRENGKVLVVDFSFSYSLCLKYNEKNYLKIQSNPKYEINEEFEEYLMNYSGDDLLNVYKNMRRKLGWSKDQISS